MDWFFKGLEFMSQMNVKKVMCKNTDKFYDNMISFPFHIWMKNDEFVYLMHSVKKSLIELRKKR